MYNGIGLTTARGSGTNGYVQRNLSFVKQVKKPIEYKSEDDFKRLERELNRVPNKEILEHQNKRQIELKCLELEDKMEEQGYTAEEIEVKVKEFRESLTQKMETSVRKKTEWLLENLPQNLKETHKMAEANHQKNDNLKAALAISPYFIEGSSLDATRKAKEAMAAEQALQQKKYTLVKDPSPEPQIKNSKNESKDEKHKKQEKSKKRNSRKKSSESESDSEDSDSSDDSSKKRKKYKSGNKRSKDKKSRKTKDRKSRKSRKYSDSSSGSDSDSDSDSGSSSDSLSGSTDSSDDSKYKSKNSRKSERSRKERRKRTPSPVVDRNRSKHSSELKESTHDFEDYHKTSHSIAMNIRQMRREAQNSLPIDRQQNTPNDDKIKESKKLSPKREPSPVRRRYSRSSSRSSERETPVKRLKSAVVETSAFKKSKEVPKSYDDKRYDSKKDRSMSPKDQSRHSSGGRKSRSRSVHSYDSKSSDRSSRSRSSSLSKSSSVSSKSSSRSKSRSRSPSIPRRKGSPSFLDKRRITSARKRPIPYRRGSPTSSLRSSRSSRSMSGCSLRSLSVSSSDSFNSNAYKLI